MFAVASCGDDGRPQTTPSTAGSPSSTTTIPEPTTTTAPSAEQLFLAAVDAGNLRTGPDSLEPSKITTATDHELIRNGRSVCKTTATGLPPDPNRGFPGRSPAEYLIVNGQVTKGTPDGERVKLAIKYLCPENQQYLDQALSGTFPVTKRTDFGDGRYTVGESIEPRHIPAGTYEALSVSDCYWERVDTTGRIIDNNFVTGAPRVVVTIRSTDAGFNSSGCGTWRKAA